MTIPGFAATTESIRTAVKQAAAAGEGARSLQLSPIATTIGQALCGTRSAIAAGELSAAWGTAISAWRAEVAGHAQRLAGAAATYDNADADNAEGLGRTGPDRAC